MAISTLRIRGERQLCFKNRLYALYLTLTYLFFAVLRAHAALHMSLLKLHLLCSRTKMCNLHLTECGPVSLSDQARPKVVVEMGQNQWKHKTDPCIRSTKEMITRHCHCLHQILLNTGQVASPSLVLMIQAPQTVTHQGDPAALTLSAPD